MNDNVKIVRAEQPDPEPKRIKIVRVEQPEPEVKEVKIVNNSLKEDKK